jgi:hypothetical protein
MAQYIKPAISGLNTGHALYSDIQAFLEFGQLDKELVGDTALTTTAALVDDVDIGDARTFDATADAILETVSITGDVTILVISRLLTGRAEGLNGNILFAYAEASGNNVTLQYEGFTPYKYISKSRANYSSTVTTNGDGFATDDAFDDGHAVAFTFDISGTNKSAMDGTLGAASSTAPTAAYAGSPVLAFMSSIGSSASANVGAIVIFNKALSDAELQSVTSDPWALTVTANQAPIAPDDSITLSDNVQNNDIVGTYTATDSDGTITGYTQDNAAFDIDNSGVITVVDNTGFIVGASYILNVTATDNEGAADTGVVTVNIVHTISAVTGITPINIGESFTVTTDGAVDLTTLSNVEATYGGIDLGSGTNITTNTVDFVAPSQGLELLINHDFVLRVNSQGYLNSVPYSATLTPPTGYSVVTLTSINSNSWLNDPDYIANAGGDANNIGAGDQFIYDNLGGTLSFSNDGLPTLTGASNNLSSTFVDWFYLDAQDGYAAGAHATLELLLPDNKVNLAPLTINLSQYQAGSLGKVRGNDKEGLL